MTDQEAAPERLLPLCCELLDRQREALIRGDIRRLERIAEGIVSVMAALQPSLAQERALPARECRQLRERVLLNRALLNNGLTSADRFAAGLVASPETTSVLLSERA